MWLLFCFKLLSDSGYTFECFITGIIVRTCGIKNWNKQTKSEQHMQCRLTSFPIDTIEEQTLQSLFLAPASVEVWPWPLCCVQVIYIIAFMTPTSPPHTDSSIPHTQTKDQQISPLPLIIMTMLLLAESVRLIQLAQWLCQPPHALSCVCHSLLNK